MQLYYHEFYNPLATVNLDLNHLARRNSEHVYMAFGIYLSTYPQMRSNLSGGDLAGQEELWSFKQWLSAVFHSFTYSLRASYLDSFNIY